MEANQDCVNQTPQQAETLNVVDTDTESPSSFNSMQEFDPEQLSFITAKISEIFAQRPCTGHSTQCFLSQMAMCIMLWWLCKLMVPYSVYITMLQEFRRHHSCPPTPPHVQAYCDSIMNRGHNIIEGEIIQQYEKKYKREE